ASGENYSAEVRRGALKALATQNGPKLVDAVQTALNSRDSRLRAEAILASAKLPDAAARLSELLNKQDETQAERQAAFTALGAVQGTDTQAADAALSHWMDKLIAGQVSQELRLD